MIEAQSGRIIKTTGDGMPVDFPGVVDAVECALSIQDHIADAEEEMQFLIL